MSAREEAKSRRRQRITRAARELMREGENSFSMRALARRAEVSIATPYNLFGSKQAILASVLNADVDEIQKRISRSQCDGVSVFFRTMELATESIAANPTFYRTLLYSGASHASEALGAEQERRNFSRTMIQAAIDQGLLAAFTNPEEMAYHLRQGFLMTVHAWLRNQVSNEEFHARCQFNLAVTLMAYASESVRPRVQALLIETQKKVEACRTPAVNLSIGTAKPLEHSSGQSGVSSFRP